MEKYQIHFGRKFFKRRDGYWQCTRDASLYAHRWVWLNHFGEIPTGMDIHHRDENPSNNDISNLLMLTTSQHLKFHWKARKFNPDQLLLAI
jgi:HNH endonuclease